MSTSPEPATPDSLEILLPGKALRLAASGPVLIGCGCRNCGARAFPTQPVCPGCMSEDIGEEEMSKSGILYSSATVHVGPPKWIKPFDIGYVDLDNGVRLLTRLLGRPAIGDRVTLGVAKVGNEKDGTSIKSFIFAAGDR